MAVTSPIWLRLAILSIFFASCLADMPTCYYPDGTATGDQGLYLPCNKTTSTGHSACCYYYDGCTTTGLCVGHGGVYYVGGCTDPTFKDPECPQICNGPKHGGWTEILDCPDGGDGTNPAFGNWCCSHIAFQNGSCCKAGQMFGMSGSSWGHVYAPWYFLRDNFLTSTSKGGSKATSTKDSGAGSTGSSSSSSSGDNSNQPNLSKSSNNSDLGTKVGLAVGIPLGVLVIATIAFFVWKEMRKSKQNQHKVPDQNGWASQEPKYQDHAQSPHYGANPAVSPQSGGVVSPGGGYGYPQIELEGQHNVQELANHPSMKR